MLSFSVIKAITLILVLSNILEIEAETAIKCFQNSDEDSKDPNKVPTSTACETSTHFCKNETSGSQLSICLHHKNKEWIK